MKGAIAATVLQLEEQDKTDDTDDEMAEQRGKLGAEHALPIIHIAEAAIHSRLQLFSEIIMQNAEVIDKLQNHPDSPLTSEKEMVHIYVLFFLVCLFIFVSNKFSLYTCSLLIFNESQTLHILILIYAAIHKRSYYVICFLHI